MREGGNELPLAHCRHGLVLLADQHGMGYVNPSQPAGGVEPAQVTAGGQHPGKHPGPRFLPRPVVEYSVAGTCRTTGPAVAEPSGVPPGGAAATHGF